MPNPPMLTQPFAAEATGGDIAVPPQTDPNGFVNFTQGYTPFYEIDLTSGNPQAKPVERNMQNGLFNLITANIQAWQQYGPPPWFAGMPGGYDINAVVIRQKGTVWTPYRSLIASNVTDPLGSPASWEYVPYPHELLSNIPMPAGGPSGSGGRLITIATDFNTFTAPGTYEFQTDPIVTGSPNSPSSSLGTAGAGILEADSWAAGSVNYILQRYTDHTGLFLTRASVGGAWGPWTGIANVPQIQAGSFNYCVDTGVANAYVAPLNPALTQRVDGFPFRFRIKNTNTGPSTINDGIGVVPLLGSAQLPLRGGEMSANGEVWLSWHAPINSYVITASSGNGRQFGAGTYIAGNGSSVNTFSIQDVSNPQGANLSLYGNGTTTPNKTIRAWSGNFEIVNSAYNAIIFRVADSGYVTNFAGETMNGGLSMNGSINLLAQTGNPNYAYNIQFAAQHSINYNIQSKILYFTNAAQTVGIVQWDDSGNATFGGTVSCHGIYTSGNINFSIYGGIAFPGGGYIYEDANTGDIGIRTFNGTNYFYPNFDTSGNFHSAGNVYLPTGNSVYSGYRVYCANAGASSGEIALASGGGAVEAYIRANTGSPWGVQFVNNAYNAVTFTVDDAGVLSNASHIYGGGNLYLGSAQYQNNGDIYMPWASNWLSNMFGNKANAGSLCVYQAAIQQIGPIAPTTNTPGTIGNTNPYVMCGMSACSGQSTANCIYIFVVPLKNQ